MSAQQVTWARHQVSVAIRQGRISRPSHCEECGAPDVPMKDGRSSIQAHHHRGYENALDVQWLCVLCHRGETPAPYGERAPAAKLDWGKVDAIRARYAAGDRYYAMAAELGLDPKTLYNVVKHKSWPEHARPDVLSSLQPKE